MNKVNFKKQLLIKFAEMLSEPRFLDEFPFWAENVALQEDKIIFLLNSDYDGTEWVELKLS